MFVKHLRSLFSLLSSRHDSKVYGISPPLQLRNDIVNIAPFKRKIVTPTRDTATGCEERLSGSGGLIIIVNTDPRLVPTHNVGINIVGSEKQNKYLLETHANL